MSTIPNVNDREWPFLAFLREELALRPGRPATVPRIAACCTIVVGAGMLYQIPETAYAVYIVFFLGRGDAAVTVQTGIAGGIAITLATLLSLVFYSLDASESALRLPLMCRFSDAGISGPSTARAAGVRKAPRHEIA
jgi:hypothetical protein